MRRYDEELLQTLHEYIIEYQKLNGSSPTYRKIANRFPSCFSSTSKVKNYLTVLSDRGLIERADDGAIKVDKRFRTEAVNAPLVGQVACGEPIEAYENIEGVLHEAIMEAIQRSALLNRETLQTLKEHIRFALGAAEKEENSIDREFRIAQIDAEFNSMIDTASADTMDGFDENRIQQLLKEKTSHKKNSG